jgi:1-acyl-sn-glycerol-3-phosphate acyltransferase
MSLRRFRRAVALAITLVLVVLRFWLLRLRGPLTMERRAVWVQQSARMVLASMGVQYKVEGRPPKHGLVVSNHLSYIDILALSAAMPCFFVAKVEIGGWPFFGKASRIGGTIFVDRSSVASNMTVAEQMTERLKLTIPIPVLLFPEGTSTDGSSILRFHSRLIDPATSIGAPITTACIRYVIDGGIEERELCWYGDDPFAPHLWKVLGVAGFHAEVQFGEPRVYPDRRTAADKTHDEIEVMRSKSVLAFQ